MFTQELLLTNEHTTEQDWLRFFNVISTRAKGLKPVELYVVFEGNIVKFFSVSKKDLTHISNGIEGFLFQSIKDEDKDLLSNLLDVNKRIFTRIPKLGTLFDLKEKYLVKEGINLKVGCFKARRVLGKLYWKREFIFDAYGVDKKSKKLTCPLIAKILDLDFFSNSSYIKKRVDNYLDIEKTASFLNTRNEDPLFSVDMFPYSTREHFLNLTDFEFDKHSFIVGSSGSGKSRLIELMIDRLQQTSLKNNYRVIVVDPHDALRENLMYMPSSRVVNFSKEGTSLFPDSQADITASTELTSSLLLSMMGATSNPRLERVLRFSTYVLFVAQAMSMTNMKRFLTELETRTQILSHVSGYIPDNIEHFFGSEFNDIKTQYYVEAIQPIIALIDEMELQPTLHSHTEVSMLNIIEENFLTVISLNKVSMGEKVVKTVAGLLIQQIFLLAQARAFDQKIILFVDEVSVVQNPTLSAILAEARKFGMSVVLTQQYFGQVETGLQQAILSNAINYYVFKVSEEDARILEGNLSMELPKAIVEAELLKGLTETDIRVKMMTELNPRECIVRVAAGGKVLPAIKAKTVFIDSASKYSSDGIAPQLQAQEKQDLPEKFKLKKERSYKTIEEPVVSVSPESSIPMATTARVAKGTKLSSNLPEGRAKNTNVTSARKDDEALNMAQVLAAQSSSRLPIKDKLEDIQKDIDSSGSDKSTTLKPYKFEEE